MATGLKGALALHERLLISRDAIEIAVGRLVHGREEGESALEGGREGPWQRRGQLPSTGSAEGAVSVAFGAAPLGNRVATFAAAA